MLFKHLLFCSMCRLQRMFRLLREWTSCRFKSFSSGSSASLVAAQGGNDFPANSLAGNEPGKVNIYVDISHFTSCQLASRSSQSCFAIVYVHVFAVVNSYSFQLRFTTLVYSVFACILRAVFSWLSYVIFSCFAYSLIGVFVACFCLLQVINPIIVLLFSCTCFVFGYCFFRDMFLSGFLGGVR